MRGKKNPLLPGRADPQSLANFRERHLAAMDMRGYSAETVDDRRRELHTFIVWATDRGAATPADVTKAMIEDWQRHLFGRCRADGRPLSFRTQMVKLTRLRGFFRWLAREGHIATNPAADIELPRTERRLPSNTVSAQEAERVLGVPDVGDPLGLRDRAILELLYATAIPCSELVKLSIGDVDCARGLLAVRQGKGKKTASYPSVRARASGLWLTSIGPAPGSPAPPRPTLCSSAAPVPG